MIAYDVWIYAKPAEWDSLGTDAVPFSHAHANAVTGYWKTFTGGYEVYNVLGTLEDVQDILDALTDVAHVYSWTQGDGFDSLDQWPTDPVNVLAVMKDHVVYAIDSVDGMAVSSVVETVPATLENPNWGCMYFGQEERIFAGNFSSDFNGDFL